MLGLRRLVLAGVAVVVLEALTGVFALAALGPVKIALYPVACATATALVTGLGALAIRRHDGGGGSRGDDENGDDPPPWWPEFERDFRRHARERERTPA
ncbi:MAG: hypothetical protein ACR2IN_04630 [Thermoleophilaceae bacterium]|jgi:hypothetical protein